MSCIRYFGNGFPLKRLIILLAAQSYAAWPCLNWALDGAWEVAVYATAARIKTGVSIELYRHLIQTTPPSRSPLPPAAPMIRQWPGAANGKIIRIEGLTMGCSGFCWLLVLACPAILIRSFPSVQVAQRHNATRAAHAQYDNTDWGCALTFYWFVTFLALALPRGSAAGKRSRLSLPGPGVLVSLP